MEQVLYSLPDGWKWLTLSETTLNAKADIVDGPFGSNLKASEYVNEGVPILRLQNVDRLSFINKNIQFITKEKAEQLSRHSYKVGDIVITKLGAPLGKACIVPDDFEDGRIVADIVRARINEDAFDKRYICYAINSSACVRQLESQTKGATRPRVNLSHMRGLILPVAPISEQKRIVEKLDALLTRIDSAIEHLNTKLDLSKNLFDSILDEFFKLTDCNSVPLTEVVDFIGGSQPPKSEFSDIPREGFVRLIQIRDYKSDNFIVYVDSASTKKFCTKDDIMIGRYGPPVFQILRGLEGAYNVALMKAVPNEDVLTKDYLYWFLQSPSIQNYVISISQRAAGQSGVNKTALEKYLIPIPSKEIQDEIVAKVGQLVSKSRDLESEVSAEIESLSQLKASILDSAFKGEL